MGCDIHIALERKVGNKWVMVNRVYQPTRGAVRNYWVFARLAGIDNFNEVEHHVPLGLPEDISESTKMWYDESPKDNHTPSYMSVEEACKWYLLANEDEVKYNRRSLENEKKKEPKNDNIIRVYKEILEDSLIDDFRKDDMGYYLFDSDAQDSVDYKNGPYEERIVFWFDN